ncbi:MAG: aminotransferase class V-fold PLP-dependent enzyme [Ruminiclostridium sp.]|nr:aminotransferase class V-fold PLP-dependent enzyme [Ruminiclostridium sp.]
MIYFDSAATTLQKPPMVARAMARATATMASPGRGDYGPAARASRILLACREMAGRLFQVEEPERVIVTTSATHGLNIAIRSLVQPDSTVLLSGWEHNAVTRPLAAIPGVRIRAVRAPLFAPDRFLEELEQNLRGGVDVVVCTHVSNVFGYILPVAEVAKLCCQRQVPLIVDAAQSAGVLPLRLEDWGAEYVAMPGHKGLYGPQGTGLLLCRRAAGEPLLYGGTGSASRLQEMPPFLPDRLEAGTHNIPGVAGLLEGMRFVGSKKPGVIFRHECALREQAAAGLKRLPGVEVFSTRGDCQSGVLSFRLPRLDVGQVAEFLGSRGIAVRSGLHCAPLAHGTGGTATSGTVRLSFSAFNTHQEVERFLQIMRRLV